jgi:hypothetical protein
MAIPQLPLFTAVEGGGVDNLNVLVGFINQLWRFVYSFMNTTINLNTYTSGPVNLTPDVRIASSYQSAPITYNLPLLPYVNETHTIKDAIGNAGTNNITIQGGGINIDGAASYVINFNLGAITLAYDGTQWIAVA